MHEILRCFCAGGAGGTGQVRVATRQGAAAMSRLAARAEAAGLGVSRVAVEPDAAGGVRRAVQLALVAVHRRRGV